MYFKPMIVVLVLMVFVPLSGSTVGAAEIREHTIEKTYNRKLSYRCIVSLPDGYKADGKQSWPMILFLHGGGMPKPAQLKKSIQPLTKLPAIVVAPLCPPSPDGPRYTNWDWKQLGEVVRQIGKKYRVDEKRRSVIGFSMGGSGAWELPSYEPKLFSKSVVIAGVCHPWSLRNYSKAQVWVFSGDRDYMRKEQHETVTSANRFGVDVVETTWKGADHGGIFRKAMACQRMLNWLVKDEDLRKEHVEGSRSDQEGSE